MCGFAGEFIFGPSCDRAATGHADPALSRRMAAAVAHRGPDEAGHYVSRDGRCAIGFHRLAVIDPTGSHQPMSSPDGRLTVAFNGEIYNHPRLRAELAAAGAAFRTRGDTEVLLHLWDALGTSMVERLDGMFAFAIYDADAARLFLARDRLGQKPLWYALLPDRIVFASQPQALLVHPSVDASLCVSSVTFYAAIGYIPAPASIWRGIRKLPPASRWLVSQEPGSPEVYWQPTLANVPTSFADATSAVREAVIGSVTSHMLADVPLGILLSGGVDSAMVAAASARAAGRAGGIKTFTAGFGDPAYDERPLARAVAGVLGTDHTELMVDGAPLPILDQVVRLFGEPFGDSSALATWLICRAARPHVTVALTGDGGDEVFGGYDRYRALYLAERMGPLPYVAARLAAMLLRPLAGSAERGGLARFIRFADGLPWPAATRYLRYRWLFRPEDLPRLLSDEVVQASTAEQAEDWFLDLYENAELPDFPPWDDEVRRAQRHDLLTYLPDDLLVKSDIASMSVGLELRAPLLDHRLVCLGLSLPAEWKLDRHRGKLILRQAFRDVLPPEVLRAPKRGFGLPLGRWMRGELRDTVCDVLLDPWLYKQGILRQDGVIGLLNDHLAGRGDHGQRLWALLVLALWLHHVEPRRG